MTTVSDRGLEIGRRRRRTACASRVSAAWRSPARRDFLAARVARLQVVRGAASGPSVQDRSRPHQSSARSLVPSSFMPFPFPHRRRPLGELPCQLVPQAAAAPGAGAPSPLPARSRGSRRSPLLTIRTRPEDDDRPVRLRQLRGPSARARPRRPCRPPRPPRPRWAGSSIVSSFDREVSSAPLAYLGHAYVAHDLEQPRRERTYLAEALEASEPSGCTPLASHSAASSGLPMSRRASV